MSLPSKAEFFGENDKLIGDCFVNIGWYVDVQGMERLLFRTFPKQVYTDPRISYCIVYEWKIPMEFIRDLIPLGDEERTTLLKSFFNNPKNCVES